jgi:predicted PurR-regulated permease PerM
VAVALISLALGLMLWIFGQQAEAQLAGLSELLPRAWRDLHQRLGGSPLGAVVLRELDGWSRAGGWLVGLGPRLAAGAGAAAAGTVIVLFAGLYLAYHPHSYVKGLLLLFPQSVRARTAEVLAASYTALKQWLIGQMFSMVLVGVTTGIGLALAGVPSPVALGMIAGLGQFVPVVGPMAATIPGLLAGLAAGPETFAWAAVVYLGAAQLEANVFTPLILRQMAQLPMALTLFAVLAMGVLLGPLGVLFATPLAVVTYVFIKMVYVEGVIGRSQAPPTAGD